MPEGNNVQHDLYFGGAIRRGQFTCVSIGASGAMTFEIEGRSCPVVMNERHASELYKLMLIHFGKLL